MKHFLKSFCSTELDIPKVPQIPSNLFIRRHFPCLGNKNFFLETLPSLTKLDLTQGCSKFLFKTLSLSYRMAQKDYKTKCLMRANLEDGGRWLRSPPPPPPPPPSSSEPSSSVSELKLLLSVNADFFPPIISPEWNGRNKFRINIKKLNVLHRHHLSGRHWASREDVGFLQCRPRPSRAQPLSPASTSTILAFMAM